MESRTTLNRPVFQKIEGTHKQYSSVVFPIYKSHGAVADENIEINVGSIFYRPNGTKITVISIFEGKMYPMINYQIAGQKDVSSTSLTWFAYNIASK